MLPVQDFEILSDKITIQKVVRNVKQHAKAAFIPHLLLRCHMGRRRSGVQINICISAARYQQCPKHCVQIKNKSMSQIYLQRRNYKKVSHQWNFFRPEVVNVQNVSPPTLLARSDVIFNIIANTKVQVFVKSSKEADYKGINSCNSAQQTRDP